MSFVQNQILCKVGRELVFEVILLLECRLSLSKTGEFLSHSLTTTLTSSNHVLETQRKK
jgi:hypothetical protein